MAFPLLRSRFPRNQPRAERVAVHAEAEALRQGDEVGDFDAADAEEARDGRDVFDGRYQLNMEEEGLYKVEYECGATERVYSFTTTIDRTPPALRFSGKIDSQKRVHSALSFSGMESTDTMVLLRDAVQVNQHVNNDGTGTITDSGNYVMRVYDAAGNMKEYTFQIMVYLNAGAWLFVILVIAVIAAVVIYVFLKKKHLKIG